MTKATVNITQKLTRIDDDVRAKVLEVLESEPYYAGPETSAFEAEVAAYCGVKYGVATNSGTSALLLTLMASDIGPGHEVILPVNTFASVPEVVMFLGADCVFCDVESDGNISRRIVEGHISDRTRAIIPVHMYGHPVDMDPIMELAADLGLFVVEDAAHALGAKYKGRRVGSLGHAGIFSFAGKSITVCGQAGMAVTDDKALAERMSMQRVHGWRQKIGGVASIAELPGLNLRTSEVLAAIGRIHLTKLEAWTDARRNNAARYTKRLSEAGVPATFQEVRDDQEPGWLHYVIRVPKRDALQAHLKERGVRAGVLYSAPLHEQPAFADLASANAVFPMTSGRVSDMLTLPSHPWMSETDIDFVSDSIVDFYRT